MNKLIEFRINLNKSTTEMAAIIGVSKSYYEKIEYEDRNPSYNFITKFKAAFPNADVDSIFLTNNHTLSVAPLPPPAGTRHRR